MDLRQPEKIEKQHSRFNIGFNDILKRVSALKNKKSVGPDNAQVEALKIGGSAIVHYLQRIFTIVLNNGEVPQDWKSATVIPIHKGGNKNWQKTTDQ